MSSAIIGVLLVALSGLLLAFTFPDYSVNTLAWFALVPFLVAQYLSMIKRSTSDRSGIYSNSNSSTYLKLAAYGFLFGFIFCVLLLSWIRVFGYISWISLAVALSVFYAVFGAGTQMIMRNFNAPGRFVMIPVFWMLLEYLRSNGAWGFGWGNIGSTVENTHILSIASYVGEIGLGGVVVSFNVLLFEASKALFVRIKTTNVRAAIIVITIIVIFTGIQYMDESDRDNAKEEHNSPGYEISITVIQPNIPQSLKVSGKYNETIKSIYADMTGQALSDSTGYMPDLLVWPESVLVSYAADEKPFYGAMKEYVNRAGSSFLFGTIDKDNKDKIYNNAVFAAPGKQEQSYQKIHLVPFGEFMPMRGAVEKVNKMAKLVTDKSPGDNYSVFNLSPNPNTHKVDSKRSIRKSGYDEVGFSSIICFESADSALVGKLVSEGARMIVVLTNDGWFKDPAALEQHFRISRMRAVEYGVPVVQVANTGVTGFIDKNGRVTKKTAIKKRSILRGTVEPAVRPAVFAVFRPWLPYLLGAVFAIGIASAMIRKKRFHLEVHT
jgi:apolipoprotein N-acyltransferase